MTLTVPSLAGPSSSDVMRKPMRPEWSGCSRTKFSQAITMAARLAFISDAPRPTRSDPIVVASKGSDSQLARSPGGTTSVCPAKTSNGPWPPRVAHKLSTSPKRICSTENPIRSSRSPITCWQPASCGVTDGRAIRSRVNANVGSFASVVGMQYLVEFHSAFVGQALHSATGRVATEQQIGSSSEGSR